MGAFGPLLPVVRLAVQAVAPLSADVARVAQLRRIGLLVMAPVLLLALVVVTPGLPEVVSVHDEDFDR